MDRDLGDGDRRDQWQKVSERWDEAPPCREEDVVYRVHRRIRGVASHLLGMDDRVTVREDPGRDGDGRVVLGLGRRGDLVVEVLYVLDLLLVGRAFVDGDHLRLSRRFHSHLYLVRG
jgi:hypothetical protein